MDHFLESLLEGFFESFVAKIKDYISDIEHKVTGFGTGMGIAISSAIITGLWENIRGRCILFVFGLWAVYIVRVFVHDMFALYGLASEYWRVTMFVGVTILVLHFVTMKGADAGVEVNDGTESTSVGTQKPTETSGSFWWKSSVRMSDGEVQTTIVGGSTLKVGAKESSTVPASKRVLSRKEPEATPKARALVKPSRLVAAQTTSTLRFSANGRTTFAASIDPAELEEGLQIRSNVPFPASENFYFEVRVGIKDPEGWIGIGLCTANSLSTGMPGWSEGSFAYHGDDGSLFLENQEGMPYGPTYGMFDVIGCGVDYGKGEVFFTKNGEYIGKALSVPPGEWFAVVGLGYKGARVSMNFGPSHLKYHL